MDAKQFREFGKASIDFIADYLENIRERDVLPSVSPGYLYNLLPDEIPENSEDWKIILDDIKTIIIPGITHWQSPNFHAYYPTATSFPSIIGEMIAAGIGIMGFSWICSPACTELEVVVMDWIGKLLNIPAEFLHSSNGPGGGIIQGSASESVFVALLAAREQAVQKLKKQFPELTESDIRGRLVAYASDQSNSCVEKAGRLGAMEIKLIPANENFSLTGKALLNTIKEDLSHGKFPVICIATLGTTGTCSNDDIKSIGEVCQAHKLWLHIDAAYAGAALALPEYNHMLQGLNYADSLNFNLHKFMKVNFDCCAMWFRNAELITESFNVDRIYLKHKFEGQAKSPDFRHWQISLGRRFRSLKVWITLRTLGAEGIRNNIRNHINLALRFEKYILNDGRFELVTPTTLGLVCFRLKGDNFLTKRLLEQITERKKIYCIEANRKEKHFLRFVVAGFDPKKEDIDYAWNEIHEQTNIICNNNNIPNKVHIMGAISENFSNLPMTIGEKEL